MNPGRSGGQGNRDRRVQAPPGFPFKIGELSARSGVPVQTIRFYVAEGLLPGAHKTQRNMGWYSQLHLDRLALVQQLQRDRFLPLKTIRVLVEGNEKLVLDDDDAAITHLRERLSHAVPGSQPEAGLTSLRAGESAPVLSAAERSTLHRLLEGVAGGPERAPDPELARHWGRVRDALGLGARSGPEVLNLIGSLVDRAVEHELEFMGARFRQLSPLEAEKIFDVIIPCLNRMFGLLHWRRLGTSMDGLPTVAARPR